MNTQIIEIAKEDDNTDTVAYDIVKVDAVSDSTYIRVCTDNTAVVVITGNCTEVHAVNYKHTCLVTASYDTACKSVTVCTLKRS